MSGRQGRGGWRGAKTTRTTGCLLSVTITIHHRGHDPRISHATLFLLAFIPLAAPTSCSEVTGRGHWNRRPSPPARYLSRLPLPRAPPPRSFWPPSIEARHVWSLTRHSHTHNCTGWCRPKQRHRIRVDGQKENLQTAPPTSSALQQQPLLLACCGPITLPAL